MTVVIIVLGTTMAEPPQANTSGDGVINLGDSDEDNPDSAASSTPSRTKKWFRPPTARSIVWKHMQHDEKKTLVKCDHCPRTFKFNTGGTSTLRRHLNNVHRLNLVEDPSPGQSQELRQLSIEAAMNRDEYYTSVTL